MRKSRFNGCISTMVTSVARASPSFRHHFTRVSPFFWDICWLYFLEMAETLT
jgi:hypothetical protein